MENSFESLRTKNGILLPYVIVLKECSEHINVYLVFPFYSKENTRKKCLGSRTR